MGNLIILILLVQIYYISTIENSYYPYSVPSLTIHRWSFDYFVTMEMVLSCHWMIEMANIEAQFVFGHGLSMSVNVVQVETRSYTLVTMKYILVSV